jgi:hypothetical protein
MASGGLDALVGGVTPSVSTRTRSLALEDQ